MSIQAVSHVLEEWIHLEGDCFKTAVLIADCTNRRTQIAYPSVAWLAARLGRSRRQVQRHLATLRQVGCIETCPRPETTSIYRFVTLAGGGRSDTPQEGCGGDVQHVTGEVTDSGGWGDSVVSPRTVEPDRNQTPDGAQGFSLRAPPRRGTTSSLSAALFSEGLALLGETRAMRSRLAGLRRRYGDDAVLEAIRTVELRMRDVPVVNASEYLEGVLRTRSQASEGAVAPTMGRQIVGEEFDSIFRGGDQ